uniref:Uncharacterized protein n=1 Tax=Amphimedon queenslandica TaxID=400682 RepID=A0A1X7U8M4_AMPQE
YQWIQTNPFLYHSSTFCHYSMSNIRSKCTY